MSVNGFNNFQQTNLQSNLNSMQMPSTAGGYPNQTLAIQPATINSSPVNIGFVRGKMGVSTFPIMSSNTTVYLFDVQDQSRFYVKATDAFGMAMPIREFEYHEIIQQPTMPEIFPQGIANNAIDTNNENISEDIVTKKEFEELKAQLSTLLQQIQNNKPQQYNKPRKEKTDNV